MKITRIEEQKNRKGRYNIYVNDEFVAGVCADVLIKCDLHEDKEMTNSSLVELINSEEYQKCLARAYDLLSRRPQSEKEIRQKFYGKFSKAAIDKVVSRLTELNYVNDINFARVWVENRSSSRGPGKLKQELSQKGITKEVIEHTIANCFSDRNLQFETALTLAKKKFKEEFTNDELWSKVGGTLSRRGFDYEVIKTVINTLKQKNPA